MPERWHCVKWRHPDPDAGVGMVVTTGPAEAPREMQYPELEWRQECGAWGLTREGGYVHGFGISPEGRLSEAGPVMHVGHGAMVEVPEPDPSLMLLFGVALLAVLTYRRMGRSRR